MNRYLPDWIGNVVRRAALSCTPGGVSLAASFIAVFSHGLACLQAPATYFNLLTSLFFYLMVFCFFKNIYMCNLFYFSFSFSRARIWLRVFRCSLASIQSVLFFSFLSFFYFFFFSFFVYFELSSSLLFVTQDYSHSREGVE